MSVTLNLKGRTALVCASSAGIGAGIAENLLMSSCNVVICGRSEKRLNEAIDRLSSTGSGRLLAVRCDLNDPDDIENLHKVACDQFGMIDILVHNQGGPSPGELKDLTIQDLDSAYKSLVRPVFQLNGMCIPSMIDHGWGRIINILSVSAKQPLPNMLLSNVFRPALQGMAKSLANDLGKHGITVNSLLPANVLSDRTNSIIKSRVEKTGQSFDEILQEISAAVPMKNMVNPIDFGAMVAFLSSDRASFITGTTIPIDGGLVSSLT